MKNIFLALFLCAATLFASVKEDNLEKFAALKEFNLPTNQYIITGSGPLGIRNLRAIGDIDILVSEELWSQLADEYGITDNRKVVFPGGMIEAFHEGSFPESDFTIASRIASAEIIDGLPFDSVETILYYKKKTLRPKDLKDIQLIEEWLRTNHYSIDRDDLPKG